MRLLIAINRICYGSCLLAIVGGAFITVGAIWLEQEGVGWKGVSTAAVLIFAAILVLAVNSIIGLKVMNDGGGFIEIQGTAEGHAFRREELDALLVLAGKGVADLCELQRLALAT